MSLAATLASHAHKLLTVNIERETVQGFTDLDSPAVGIGGPNGSGGIQSYVDTTLAYDTMPAKALMETVGGVETAPQHIWTPSCIYLGVTS